MAPSKRSAFEAKAAELKAEYCEACEAYQQANIAPLGVVAVFANIAPPGVVASEALPASVCLGHADRG